MLIPCDLQGFTKTPFCFIEWLVGLSEQQFAFQSKQFRLPKKFSLSCGNLLSILNSGEAFAKAFLS